MSPASRTYEDRLETIGNVRDAGISVCCGGILGLGEVSERTWEAFLISYDGEWVVVVSSMGTLMYNGWYSFTYFYLFVADWLVVLAVQAVTAFVISSAL